MEGNWNVVDDQSFNTNPEPGDALNLLSLVERPRGSVGPAVTGDQIAFLVVAPGPVELPRPGDQPPAPGAGGQETPAARAARADIPRAEAPGNLQPEPARPEADRKDRLRLGVDFDAPAPLPAEMIGNRYVQAAQNNVPLAVRQSIERSIAQLGSPETREQADQRLRDYGPAAVPFLIAELDSPNFQRRDAAHAQLIRMGDAALPGMLSTRDGAESLEMQRRLDSLIDQLAPGNNGDVFDAQGRLRRSRSLFGNTLAADYDTQGRLTNVTMDRGTTRETFLRQPNGTFNRLNDSVPVRDVSVGRDGAVSFRVGDASVVWSSDGGVQVAGAPVSTDMVGGIMTVPVRSGNAIVNVSVLPRPTVEPQQGGRRRQGQN